MTVASRLMSHSDSDDEPVERTETVSEPTADDSVTDTALFRLGRVLFGGVLAFNAIDNLRNLEERIGYAEFKGVPEPDRTVPAASVGLLLGGLGVVLWKLPAAAALGIAGFLAGTTPVMHDYWNQDDEESKQQERIQFLKNTALFGAALALARVARGLK
ncbi:DoxX family membrane protein [Natronococcus sp. A-GB1]|uniref:DoxX family membrane protein n=1 Tax=Natronococcus sp. A-GB1 TaxID=3037648 RepID=UPI00241F1455|nr:DoxX family membrane protein [Natronococcus sp. A-GB1]MDG5761170.1 DoxX family membrane protein [Natronococcus sp. A-GB1]